MRQALWDRYFRSDTGVCDAELMAFDIELLCVQLRNFTLSHCFTKPDRCQLCRDAETTLALFPGTNGQLVVWGSEVTRVLRSLERLGTLGDPWDVSPPVDVAHAGVTGARMIRALTLSLETSERVHNLCLRELEGYRAMVVAAKAAKTPEEREAIITKLSGFSL